MFRIGEFARLARVSVRALRRYDALGLLVPAHVDARTGYRAYDAAQLPRLARLRELRALGLALAEVAALLDAQDAPAAERAAFTRHRLALRARLRADRARLIEIEARLAAAAAGSTRSTGGDGAIVLAPLGPCLVATRRAVVPLGTGAVARLFDEVEAFAAHHRARAAEPPLAILHDTAGGAMRLPDGPTDVEVAVPLTGSVTAARDGAADGPAGAVCVRELDAAPLRVSHGASLAATLVYRGAYTQTGPALDALHRWALRHGLAPAGPARERYLRFGVDDWTELSLAARARAAYVADRTEAYVTEVQLPVARAASARMSRALRASPTARLLACFFLAGSGAAFVGTPTAGHAQARAVIRVGDRDGAPCEPPIAGVRTTCTRVLTPAGYSVRVLRTASDTPDRGGERRPAVLFVQWLSCDPVTVPDTGGDGWARMLREVAQRSGMVLARTEKPGLPGSEGPPCARLGYDEELAAHRAALTALRAAPGVDPDSIYLFGGSMGGTMVPLLAADPALPPVRGVLVWGTTALPWAEHLVALDRRVFEGRVSAARPAAPPDSVAVWMPAQLRLHATWLAPGAAPSVVAAVVAGDPRLAAAWRRQLGVDPGFVGLYGRSVAFHQEAARANWEGAWARVVARGVPVVVLRGACDALMSGAEHARIAAVVDAVSPGRARYGTVPGTTHGLQAAGCAEAPAGSAPVGSTVPGPPRRAAPDDGRAVTAIFEALRRLRGGIAAERAP